MIKVVLFDVGGVLIRFTGVQIKLYLLADKIKAKGVRIAILSNIVSFGGLALKRLHIYRGFSTVILSYQEGVRKPEQKIYDITIKRLGVKPSEILFIDNLPENLVPAKKMGIHVVHAKSTSQTIRDIKQILKTQNNLEL